MFILTAKVQKRFESSKQMPFFVMPTNEGGQVHQFQMGRNDILTNFAKKGSIPHIVF